MASDVTIVIPAYNAAGFIEKTVESALKQTVKADEIIVVDDASTDNTIEKLRTFGDAIRVIHCQKNSKVASRPRNIGIDHARTRFVIPFDADDLLYPARVERQIEILRRNPELKVIFSDFHVVRGSEQLPEPHCVAHADFRRMLNPIGGKHYFLPQRAAFEAFMHENFIGAGALMVEKAAWKAVGGYNESLRSAEDLDFNLRLAEHFDMGFVDEPLYAYLIHPKGKSANKLCNFSCALRLMRRYVNRPMSQMARLRLHEQIATFELDLSCINGDLLQLRETARHFWESLKFGGPRVELLKPGKRIMRGVAKRIRGAG